MCGLFGGGGHRFGAASLGRGSWSREDEMPSSRRAVQSGRAYAAPLLWVALLMVCYWVLAEWPELPKLFALLKVALHWPA